MAKSESAIQFKGSYRLRTHLFGRSEHPDIALNARSFVFNLTDVPNDVNTSQDAYVAGGKGSWSDALSVVKQQLTVVNVTEETYREIEDAIMIMSRMKAISIHIDNNFKKGAKNTPVLVFNVTGPGAVALTIDSLALQFLEPLEDELMQSGIIAEMIDSIKIVPLSYLMNSISN